MSKFRIPVNWTRRAILEVDAASFPKAVARVKRYVKDREQVKATIASKPISVTDIPWSYEVDIDACDVYQTPEALERMFDNE